MLNYKTMYKIMLNSIMKLEIMHREQQEENQRLKEEIKKLRRIYNIKEC